MVEACEKEIEKRGEKSLYLFVLPQELEVIKFWAKLGYNVLNSFELVKDFKPAGREKGEKYQFKGIELYLWDWKK